MTRILFAGPARISRLPLKSLLPALVIAASFGPYILPSYGIRLEHIVIYSLFAAALVALPLRGRVRYAYTPLLFSLVVFAFVTLWTGVVTIGVTAHDRSLQKAIAHAENYIQPIAVIGSIITLVSIRSSSRLEAVLDQASKLVVGLLAAHTLLVIASIWTDVSFVARHFIAESDITSSVWARSAALGRHVGIFAQPMESGLMYSLGAFLWVYLARKAHRVQLAGYLSAFALVVGGVLSVSKIFILGGLPLALTYWFWGRGFRRLANWRLVAAAILVAVPLVVTLKSWEGRAYLARLWGVTRASDLAQTVDLLTSGRFGAEESLPKTLFSRVWKDAPVSGVGFGAEPTLDSAYAEFFVQGGIVGLAGYLFILACMFWVAFDGTRKGSEEGRLLAVLCVLVLFAGIGAPVVTANRFSPVFWVIVSLLCMGIFDRARHRRNGDAPRGPSRHTANPPGYSIASSLNPSEIRLFFH